MIVIIHKNTSLTEKALKILEQLKVVSKLNIDNVRNPNIFIKK